MTTSKQSLMVCVGATGFILGSIVLAGVTFVAGSPRLVKDLLAWKMGGEFLGEEGVVLQDKHNNCGPAALQMVFDHYGITSTVSEIERHVKLTKRGSSMLALKTMAELKGLCAEGWRYAAEDFLEIPLPAICFVHNDHFVVADSVTNDGALFLRDPALGRLRIRLGVFSKFWKGEVLLFRRVFNSG